MENKSIVKIENLVKRYKDLLALDHLNLEIKEGEIFGYIKRFIKRDCYQKGV